MREIKFRGKRKDNGEWIDGNFYESKISGCFMLVSKMCASFKRDGSKTIRDMVIPFEINPETVGQYIGLKDKNGKEIYEGIL